MVLLGFFLFPKQSDKLSVAAEETFVDLGVTYLPVTARLSAYYDLGVSSGALVTEVMPNSLADKAGVWVGDVILSFNGFPLAEGDSSLGMMRGCPIGDTAVLEVWREKKVTTVKFGHAEKDKKNSYQSR